MHGEFYSKHFSLEKIRDGIFAAIAKDGGGSVANAGLIDLGDQTILFDTFNTQQAAEDLKKIAEKITNRNITWVINSHWHGDHIRGNQVFHESKIISSELTRDKMKSLYPERIRQQKNGLAGLTAHIQALKAQNVDAFDQKLANQISFLSEIETSLPTLELTLPQQTFKDELTLHGTNRTANLITLGGGHSYCDAFLYIPEEKVIFMGDLLFVDSHPSLFEESNPEKWIQILEKVIEDMNIEIAVPGHGPVGKKHNIFDVVNYLNDLIEIASKNKDNFNLPTKYESWSSPEIFKQNMKRLREKLIKRPPHTDNFTILSIDGACHHFGFFRKLG